VAANGQDLPRLTPPINSLIERFETLDLSSAALIEPALLEPFLAPGDFLNISAAAGTGKSMLGADMILGAVADYREGVALGGLIRFDTSRLTGRNVAIIDAEDMRHRWETYVRRRAEREGRGNLDLGARVIYIKPTDFGLHVPASWTTASENTALALAHCQVELVLIDTLARVWAPDDVSSSGWVQRGLAPFRAACKRYGITVIALSHTPRPTADKRNPVGPIGTSFQESQVDTQIIMTRTIVNGGQGVELEMRKCRRAYWIQQGIKVRVRFTSALGYEPVGNWQDVLSHGPLDDSPLDEPYLSSEARVLDSLKASAPKWVSSTNISTDLDVSPRTVTSCLNNLKRRSLAEKEGNGPSRRWRYCGA
jgi:hypothetical protein